MVVDAQDLEVAEVDEGVQTLDRMRVVIVEREGPHPHEAVEDAAPALDVVAELAHRPRVDAHELDLLEETTAPQGLPEPGVGLHGLLDLQDLFDRHHGAGILVEMLRVDRAGFQVDAALPDAELAAFEGVVTGDPLEGLTGLDAPHHGRG